MEIRGPWQSFEAKDEPEELFVLDKKAEGGERGLGPFINRCVQQNTKRTMRPAVGFQALRPKLIWE